jgi:hypothetical protein
VLDRLAARAGELESCQHDPEGFAKWIPTSPDQRPCCFCHQAAQVLAQDIRCPACGEHAEEPDNDALVVANVTSGLGAHFYLCGSCADPDLGCTGSQADAPPDVPSSHPATQRLPCPRHWL